MKNLIPIQKTDGLINEQSQLIPTVCCSPTDITAIPLLKCTMWVALVIFFLFVIFYLGQGQTNTLPVFTKRKEQPILVGLHFVTLMPTGFLKAFVGWLSTPSGQTYLVKSIQRSTKRVEDQPRRSPINQMIEPTWALVQDYPIPAFLLVSGLVGGVAFFLYKVRNPGENLNGDPDVDSDDDSDASFHSARSFRSNNSNGYDSLPDTDALSDNHSEAGVDPGRIPWWFGTENPAEAILNGLHNLHHPIHNVLNPVNFFNNLGIVHQHQLPQVANVFNFWGGVPIALPNPAQNGDQQALP